MQKQKQMCFLQDTCLDRSNEHITNILELLIASKSGSDLSERAFLWSKHKHLSLNPAFYISLTIHRYILCSVDQVLLLLTNDGQLHHCCRGGSLSVVHPAPVSTRISRRHRLEAQVRRAEEGPVRVEGRGVEPVLGARCRPVAVVVPGRNKNMT